MGLTYTLDPADRISLGNNFMIKGSLGFDASYPTGGLSFNIPLIGLFRLDQVDFDETQGYSFEYDLANDKVKVLLSAGGVSTGVNGNASGGTPSGSVSQALYTATGRQWFTQSYFDVMGATRLDNPNVDGVERTNAAYVAPYTTVAAGAGAVGALTNPDVPRSIVISIRNPTGGALNLFEGVMTFTVSGLECFSNLSKTSTITLTSTAGNKSIAAGSFRSVKGTGNSLFPYRTITSVTLDNVPDNGLDISVGLGTNVHLISFKLDEAGTNIIQSTLNGVTQTIVGNVHSTTGFPRGTISYIYPDFVDGSDTSATFPFLSGNLGSISAQSFTGVALADHTHVFTGGSGGGGAETEVPNGTDLSFLTGVQFRAYGV